MLHSICQQIWKPQQWWQDWKRSVFLPIPKKGNAKECSNYRTIVVISHASKVMFKILQCRLQQHMNHETLWCSRWIYKTQRNWKSICQHPLHHRKSKRVPEKYLLLLYWLCQSIWLEITTSCGKFLERREYQTTLLASWEICVQVKNRQLELDMEQQTASKQEKEYIKAVYCHPIYLTSRQSTSWETLDWKKHRLESRCQEKYQ